MSPEAPPAWHVGDWGPLAWAETALKTAGILVGIAALLTALEREPDGASGARLVAVVILRCCRSASSPGSSTGSPGARLVGFLFILGMVAGHVAMTVALARDGGLEGYLAAFAALMLAGDLVKLVFLRTTGFRARDVPPAVVYGLTSAYAVAYVALLVIAPAV